MLDAEALIELHVARLRFDCVERPKRALTTDWEYSLAVPAPASANSPEAEKKRLKFYCVWDLGEGHFTQSKEVTITCPRQDQMQLAAFGCFKRY